MRKKKAIKILEEQKQKVLSSDHLNDDEWIIETASYIRDFFGFESTEYFRFAKFKWHVKSISGESNESTIERLNKNKSDIIQFLENCKRTLNNKGLLKEPKKNFLSDKSTFELLGILFAIGLFGFGIGYWTKKFEIFSVVSQTEKSISIPSSNSTENISDKKDNVTKGENSKNK